MKITAKQLYDYIKKNGLTKAKTTKKFHNIPKGTELVFGICNGFISTYNEDTDNLNKYDFDYGWSVCWYNKYKGEFEVIETNILQIENKGNNLIIGDEVKELKQIPSEIEYKGRIYVLK